MDFGRAEAVDVDLREARLMSASNCSYQASVSSGCRPPCSRIWSPPSCDRLFDLLPERRAVEHVGLRRSAGAAECAEAAAADTDVRVVDVAIDVVGAEGLGMEPARRRVGRLPQRGQVARFQQLQPLGRAERPPATALEMISVAGSGITAQLQRANEKGRSSVPAPGTRSSGRSDPQRGLPPQVIGIMANFVPHEADGRRPSAH